MHRQEEEINADGIFWSDETHSCHETRNKFVSRELLGTYRRKVIDFPLLHKPMPSVHKSDEQVKPGAGKEVPLY